MNWLVNLFRPPDANGRVAPVVAKRPSRHVRRKARLADAEQYRDLLREENVSLKEGNVELQNRVKELAAELADADHYAVCAATFRRAAEIITSKCAPGCDCPLTEAAAVLNAEAARHEEPDAAQAP